MSQEICVEEVEVFEVEEVVGEVELEREDEDEVPLVKLLEFRTNVRLATTINGV